MLILEYVYVCFVFLRYTVWRVNLVEAIHQPLNLLIPCVIEDKQLQRITIPFKMTDYNSYHQNCTYYF